MSSSILNIVLWVSSLSSFSVFIISWYWRILSPKDFISFSLPSSLNYFSFVISSSKVASCSSKSSQFLSSFSSRVFYALAKSIFKLKNWSSTIPNIFDVVSSRSLILSWISFLKRSPKWLHSLCFLSYKCYLNYKLNI